PIIMTAAATIGAMIPPALGLSGQSSFVSAPMSVAVIGGLIASTLITLIIVPVLYRMTEGTAENLNARQARREQDAVGVENHSAQSPQFLLFQPGTTVAWRDMINTCPTNGDVHDPMSEIFRKMFGENAPDPEEIQRAMNQFGASGMPFDPSMMDLQMMQHIMQQFQSMMQSSGDAPVNWHLAKQPARQSVAGQDPSVGTFSAREVEDALRLADSWLDKATTLEAANVPIVAWSRAEWVESTMDDWREMTDPVATSLSEALTRAITEQLPGQLPEELQGAFGNMQPMMKNLGGS